VETERSETGHAAAKSNRQSGDRFRWFPLSFFPSLAVVGLSFVQNAAISVAAAVMLASIGLIVSRFPNRHVMYGCSLAVLLFAGIFTLGIVGDTKSVPSEVTAMWSSGGGFGPDEYCVDVTCSEASGGKLSAFLRKGDWERIMREDWSGTDDPCPVELTYRTQSILDIASLEPVAEAIDSKLVIADRRQFPRGGILGRVALPVTLILAVLPLAYLVYKDRRELFGGGTGR
jgi:hypothetical protein